MANLILQPDWQGRVHDCTPEGVYANRRAFIRQMGLGALGMAAGLTTACEHHAVDPLTTDAVVIPADPLSTISPDAPRVGLPAPRNDTYAAAPRPRTDRLAAASYNNFYEFTAAPRHVWKLTGRYRPFPWTISVEGLVQRPLTLDVEQLIRSMSLEERIYRLRCVETWSMVVPWTGFPLASLLARCNPLSRATHVQFICADRADEMPGIESQPWYAWPYYEALRLDEATNELAFIATGIYGEPLPAQHGAPLRVVLPWKYGFKGPKAVTRLVFTDSQPRTFWNDEVPEEYGFVANVNPGVPHPRWSQELDRPLGEETTYPTQLFNGYAQWVGALYPDEA